MLGVKTGTVAGFGWAVWRWLPGHWSWAQMHSENLWFTGVLSGRWFHFSVCWEDGHWLTSALGELIGAECGGQPSSV